MPPHPPGYRSPVTGPHAPTPAPTTPPPGDRGSRLMSALVGGLVGAVVAAMVAAGLVLATDDDPAPREEASTTTEAGGSGMGVGESLDIHELLETARPSVVSITHEGGAGSGWVYDATEGLIVTNHHVIEDAEEIAVSFYDGTVMGAEVLGSFPADDVALLKVEGVENMVAAELGSSDALQVGDDVVAIGNALALGFEPTVTSGIVSAKDRDVVNEDGNQLTGLIQTDAAINHGNSGGPLFNAQGQVVGINTLGSDVASNIGFALAIDNVRPLIEDLREGNGETAESADVGVTVIALADGVIDPELLEQMGITSQAGLLVAEVRSGTGAADADIEEGDVILEVDGEVVNDRRTYDEIIRSRAVGETVTLTIDRLGERIEVPVTLGRRGG